MRISKDVAERRQENVSKTRRFDVAALQRKFSIINRAQIPVDGMRRQWLVLGRRSLCPREVACVGRPLRVCAMAFDLIWGAAQMIRRVFGERVNRFRAIGHWIRGSAVASVFVIAGCAATGSLSTDSPVEVKHAVVKQRITARWEALKKGDIDGSYAFLSPASRDATTLEMYKSRVRPTDWKSVTIDAVECEAEICKVRLQVTYDFRLESGKLMQGIKSLSNETWIIEKGTAWYVWGV